MNRYARHRPRHGSLQFRLPYMPEPYTQHPAPCTLHPESTMNHEPLNHEPGVQGQGPLSDSAR